MTKHTVTSHSPLAARSTLPTAEIDEELARYEAARTEQLEQLESTSEDPIAVAHRESVVRILGEIRTARRRLAAGLYGSCVVCGGGIAAERLELRPWTTTCISCARRRHS